MLALLEMLAQTFIRPAAPAAPPADGWSIVTVGTDGVSILADGLSLSDALAWSDCITRETSIMAPANI